MSYSTNGAHPPEAGKGIPANLDAERAVLGSCLIDPEALGKVTGFLKPEDFYRERHAWLYRAMQALAERREPLDFVTVTDELERKGQLGEIGGPSFLTDLLSNTPTALYVDHYARIVEREAALRRLIGAAGKIAELAFNGADDVDGVIDRAEQLIMGVSEGRLHRQVEPVGAILPEVIDRIADLARSEGQLMGVPTGFGLLDRMLGGLQKSDLIVLAGRPGMGKSAWSLSVALNAAKRHDARIAVFSLEMSKDQLVQRLLSMETGIDTHRLRLGQLTDDEWPLLLEAANGLTDAPIFIDDTPEMSVTELRAKARRLHAEHGLDLILIDYMQLMSGQETNGRGSENRQQEVSYISRSLKGLARELNVPVLALAQLSRAVESRADKRPILSDLRDSGSIEQDCDVVLFLYREDYYIVATHLDMGHWRRAGAYVQLDRLGLSEFLRRPVQWTRCAYYKLILSVSSNGLPEIGLLVPEWPEGLFSGAGAWVIDSNRANMAWDSSSSASWWSSVVISMASNKAG